MRRRSILRSLGTGAGIALSSGITAASDHDGWLHTEDDLEYDDTFAKTDWGYVRHDWDEPAGTDRPVVVTHDGYYGASWSDAGPTHYIRTPDDALIATSVNVHTGTPAPPLSDDYVTIQSSPRATGCSSGDEEDFGEVYDRVSHGEDGKEVIEWAADQPWALDKVGLIGLSYSGMVTLRVAATQPPSLAAISANVIMGDILRGRTFPGGVDQLSFNNWLEGLTTNWWPNITPREDDPFCEEFFHGRDYNEIIENHPDWYRSREENEGYRRINFIEMAKDIEVPTYISQAWQDGQTGQRGGPAVFEALDPDPVHPGDVPGRRPPSPELRDSPKLLRATTGDHTTGWSDVGYRDARRWFDYWLKGENTGIMREPPVQLEFGMGTEESYGTMGLDQFPASDTSWERFYFGKDNTLSQSLPEAGSDTYPSEIPPDWFLEDLSEENIQTYWTDPFEAPTVIAGTITTTLYVESTEENTEIYVSLGDMQPDMEQVTYLQRGMIRASHRELDESQTRYNENGDIVRPYHTLREPSLIDPGEIYRLDIEVFPLGHLIYPGHRLFVNLHAPPREEGAPSRTWAYDPLDNGAENTVHYGANTPSSILFPTLDWGTQAGKGRGNRNGPRRGELPPEPDCGEPTQYWCYDVTLPE